MTAVANADPAAEPMSHEKRKAPAISSYPPVIFIISRKSRSCTDELTKPIINRFAASSGPDCLTSDKTGETIASCLSALFVK